MDTQPSRRHPLLTLLIEHQLVGRRSELRGGEAEFVLSGASSLDHPGQVGLQVEAEAARRRGDSEQDGPALSALRAQQPVLAQPYQTP
jgi:hypothetical protein